MTLPNLTAHLSVGLPRYTRMSLARRRKASKLAPDLLQKLAGIYSFDFSNVRIFEGPEPRRLGALAFTHGNHIYMAPGLYDPHSEEGLRLLCHELTHVVQQAQGRVPDPTGRGVSMIDDRSLEDEADRMGLVAARALLGRPAPREIAVEPPNPTSPSEPAQDAESAS